MKRGLVRANATSHRWKGSKLTVAGLKRRSKHELHASRRKRKTNPIKLHSTSRRINKTYFVSPSAATSLLLSYFPVPYFNQRPSVSLNFHRYHFALIMPKVTVIENMQRGDLTRAARVFNSV